MRGLGAALSILAVLGFPGAVSASELTAPSSYEPGELLVRWSGSATPSGRADALADIGATVVERLPLAGLVRVRLDPGTSVGAADAALEGRPEVRYAQPNHRYQLFAVPNDPSYSVLWGLPKIAAPAAWDLSTDSSSVTVAVVDSGVDYTHADLTDNIWVNAGEVAANSIDDDGNGKVDDVRGWDFVDNDATPLDALGHGTHVAGTIGARGDNAVGVSGVNWKVKLMPLRAGDTGLTDAAIVESFRYACAKGAKVVNGSFGGPDPSPATLDAVMSCPNALFVFAAGNDGTNNDVFPSHPCVDPAPNIVCVAATNAADDLAWFSNYGSSTVDLAAPGEGIYSTIPGGYAYYDGTSMATPHVAGAAALVLAYRPTLSIAELKRAVVNSVDRPASLAGKVASGGRLNISRALTQEVEPPTGLTAAAVSTAPGTWTNSPAISLTWAGATDANGVDGYSYVFSPDPGLVPDEVKDAEESATSLTWNVPDGANWFHIRARDNSGNWGDPVHVGPFLVDTFPPVRPTLSSPTHRAGVASANRTVEINWAGAADSISGLDGFSFAWAQKPLVPVDQVKDVEEGVLRASSRLAPGSWWFGIRARDNAGNWTDAAVLGPFVVTNVSPVCAVPRLRGLTLVASKRRLVKGGCALGAVTRTYSRRVARGRVVAQRPGPGLRLRRGAKIAVVLSRGRRR